MNFHYKKEYSIGIALKLLNITLFTAISLLFLFIKRPLHTMQIFFLTSVVGSLAFVPWIVYTKGHYLSLKRVRSYIFRAAFNVMGMITWLEALKHIDPNQASAISYLIPILTSVLAVIFLGEKMNGQGMGAIAVSLVGLYFILKPDGSAFITYGAALALASSLMWASYDIICKKQTVTEHYLAQAFNIFVLTTLLTAPFAYSVWEPLDQNSTFYISLMGLAGAVNVTVLFLAYKFAPVVLLMPFSYCRLIIMSLATYVFFGKVLTSDVILGSVLISLASGFVFYQQRKFR